MCEGCEPSTSSTRSLTYPVQKTNKPPKPANYTHLNLQHPPTHSIIYKQLTQRTPLPSLPTTQQTKKSTHPAIVLSRNLAIPISPTSPAFPRILKVPPSQASRPGKHINQKTIIKSHRVRKFIILQYCITTALTPILPFSRNTAIFYK